ncbi:alpha/beta hydrolase [Amycolatopsis minnesotensis]
MPSSTAAVNGIRMHYRHAGMEQGKTPVVLLHGWPQTSHCWHRIIDKLSAERPVIAPDLRGYGLSDKPRAGYDKRTMAADVSELVAKLGFGQVSVVGHDRGGRVAHRWALDRPEQVARLAVLDIVPTREVWRRLDLGIATGYWHWFFHLQPDLPERLAGADVAAYLGYFFERWTYQRQGLDAAAIDEYVRAFSAPGALRAGFDDYRASFPDDAEADDADFDAGQRLTMPVLALWGSEGLPAKMPALEIWSEYANDVTGGPIEESGHFVAEEQPERLLARLHPFLRG